MSIFGSPATGQDGTVADWKPVEGRLMTRWAKEVDPENVHPEYPRPQLVRKDWQNLNGLWDYAITAAESDAPKQFTGEILVPFPIESALSGVAKSVGKDKRLWYRRSFATPKQLGEDRLLLHFGAVDWDATVSVNGNQVGTHRGGYAPFSFDVTEQLKSSGDNELLVSVWDPTSDGDQPRGKQRNDPRGIWYTPVTGIWQTVWLEQVPPTYVTRLKITPDVDSKSVELRVDLNATATDNTHVVVAIGGQQKTIAAGVATKISIGEFELWSPSNPKLYPLTVAVLSKGKKVDSVSSYYAMRKIELGTDSNGVTRLMFNDEPLFQFGPLDQGWWPDGLYTAPSDEALRYDLEVTKRLGFNMVRKHVKVEPARWYYHCDKMGLIVWQDMPNGGAHANWPVDGTETKREVTSEQQFGDELKELVDSLHNQPCIVTWVPFNEAWGQFSTVKWTRWLERYDPTRMVISASGGNDFGVGHIHDIHQYPGPEAPPAEVDRAAVLGEYGGLGLPLKGHTWQDSKNWGYRSFDNKEALQQAYLQLLTQLRPRIESRLSAAVYTQTTDVEVEVNGLMTYDRKVLKFDAATLAAAHAKLYAPLRKLTPAELSAAYTVAYWRFEKGKPGNPVPHDRNKREGVAAMDTTEHRNHVYAYARNNAPLHTADVAHKTVTRLGLSNRGALDDTAEFTGPTRDLYTTPGRSRTHMNAVNTFPFNQWTVELSFKPAELGRLQTLVGEDGKPTAAPNAPLQIQIGNDNRIAAVAIDSLGQVRKVASKQPVELGKWYHIAVGSDGKEMTLRVFDGKEYVQLSKTEFGGQLINHNGTWTIGRGFHDGKLGLDSRSVIDEVRVSSVALPDRLLLWSGN